jgi:excisionase family DNA binding protein
MTKYVTPREAARLLGVHRTTQALWEEKGRIKAIKTESGQRRYDIHSYLLQKEKESGAIPTPSTRTTVLYARVSTTGQRDDLQRQTQSLTEHYPRAEVITEVGSGLNFRRRKFIAILERIISRDIECLVVAHKDRLCRFGFELVEWLSGKFDCKIVVLYQQKFSPQEELVQDILSIIHCFSSRLYGLRKYEKHLRDELQTKNAPSSEQGEQETA